MFEQIKILTDDELNELTKELPIVKKMYYMNFIKAYRERVEKFYANEAQQYKNIFLLQEKVRIYLYINNVTVYEIVCKSEDDCFECIEYVEYLSEEECYEFEDCPEIIKHRQVKEKIGIKSEDVLLMRESKHSKIKYELKTRAYLGQLAEEDGKRKADECLTELELEMAVREIRKQTEGFKLYSVKETIEKVNIEQFNNEFTECVLAYENELYLASSLVGFVCMEALLKSLILIRLGKGKLPDKTYMIQAAQVLLDNGIITQKFFKRIQSINSLRHAIAHTSTGSVERWDVEQILTAIKLLVEEYF